MLIIWFFFIKFNVPIATFVISFRSLSESFLSYISNGKISTNKYDGPIPYPFGKTTGKSNVKSDYVTGESIVRSKVLNDFTVNPDRYDNDIIFENLNGPISEQIQLSPKKDNDNHYISRIVYIKEETKLDHDIVISSDNTS